MYVDVIICCVELICGMNEYGGVAFGSQTRSTAGHIRDIPYI